MKEFFNNVTGFLSNVANKSLFEELELYIRICLCINNYELLLVQVAYSLVIT